MSVTTAPRRFFFSAPWALATVVYGLCMTTACVLDRLNHRTFAFSRFCSDDDSQLESGPFGKQHCADHYLEWALASRWATQLWNFLIPSLGPELRFVGAHGALSLIGWINWIVGLSLVFCAVYCVLKVYAWTIRPYVKRL